MGYQHMQVLSFVHALPPNLPLLAASAGEGGVAIVAKRGRISAAEMRGCLTCSHE